MQIDYHQLLAYRVPDAVHDLTPAGAALYALSVGFGQDPLDRRQLAFVDPTTDMPIVPLMGAVLGYPGFWIAEPATTVDPAGVLHMVQGFTAHAPLRPGLRLVGKTRLTGLYRRPGGRAGLLLKSVREVRAVETGELFCTLDQTHFLRQECAQAPVAESEDRLVLPDGAPDHLLACPTRPEQSLYYRLNGDLNPIHFDPQVAARGGFDRPIMHGMCTMGMATRAVLATLCDHEPARLRGIVARFSAPLYPGEALQLEIWNDGSFRASAPARAVRVLEGRATVAGAAA